MKRIIAAVVLVLICVGLGIFEHIEVQKRCNKCLADIRKSETLVKKGKYKKAARKCARTAIDFGKTSSELMYWYYAHETLSDISTNLSEMHQFLKHGEKTQYFAIASITKNQLNSAKEYEIISIQNIL